MLDVYVIATSWSPSFFHCDNPRLKVLVRGCCGHATVFFDDVRGESCSRTDLECLRRVLPCSALLSFVLAQRSSAYLHFVWLWFCFSQYNTSHTHLHYWTADITDWHSPHLQRRGLAVGFWHQRVWNNVWELDFGHGEHENLLCTLLTSSSAPPAFTIISATRFISLNQPQAYYEHPYRNGVTLEISKRCCWCACRPLWLLLMVAFVDSSTGDLLFKWIFSDQSAVCSHLWVSLSSLDTPRLRLIPTRSPKFCPRFKKK